MHCCILYYVFHIRTVIQYNIKLLGRTLPTKSNEKVRNASYDAIVIGNKCVFKYIWDVLYAAGLDVPAAPVEPRAFVTHRRDLSTRHAAIQRRAVISVQFRWTTVSSDHQLTNDHWYDIALTVNNQSSARRRVSGNVRPTSLTINDVPLNRVFSFIVRDHVSSYAYAANHRQWEALCGPVVRLSVNTCFAWSLYLVEGTLSPWHKYSSCGWTLPTRFSRSEVKCESNDVVERYRLISGRSRCPSDRGMSITSVASSRTLLCYLGCMLTRYNYDRVWNKSMCRLECRCVVS